MAGALSLVGPMCDDYWWFYRPRLLDMADHAEGYPLDSEQALLVVCSTQVCPVPNLTAVVPRDTP